MADLLTVGALFAAIALGSVLAARLGTSVIPLYILTGMLVSPAVAGELVVAGYDVPAIQGGEFVEIGAELGIVFLLFFLGLEFNLERLVADRGRIVTAGTIDLAVNFGAGLVVGFLLFESLLAAFLLAGIVYISSSAIITKSLIDFGWIANDEAGPMLGTLVFEDLAIAVYLAIAVALVAGGNGVAGLATAVGLAMGFIVLLLLVVQFGSGAFERLLAGASNEFLVLRVVGVTVLVAGVALAIGVSEAVAAFFVGMAFASTSHVERLERLLEPVRDVFAAVFFVWIGLETDPVLVAEVAALVAIAVAATTPTKLFSGYLGGRAYGLSPRRSTRVGLGMVTRGEFSLIIAAVAIEGAGGTLSAAVASDIYAFAVGYVLAMSVLGTVLMQYSGPFERFAVGRFGME
ncbi:sodium/protn antiporter putative [Salinarchaeum sp. Harcht-Bsk1]|uniref:cation:proton antiporter n=1 Tax=Salinarchaeum sp. Harcht-Bsk1 TaxID=1333523 RepID=UPI0003423903|nr:cation:proton antiporter [Salinarchaeum sp. Harcht-Bsk1]AGN01342.1 sodium/protn antiporter putative [Salinarchaeum sp. Harcht-Bsk1]